MFPVQDNLVFCIGYLVLNDRDIMSKLTRYLGYLK